MNMTVAQSIIKCPITGASLERLSEVEVVRFNQKVKQGAYFFGDGTPVDIVFEALLKADSAEIYYPIQQDILCLLPDFAMVQDCTQFQFDGDPLDTNIKHEIKAFYDQVGWQQDQTKQFKDATDSEDLRAVSKDYIHQCHLRLKQYLPQKGQFLLDAASGPIQYPEYLKYSKNYRYRICVDLSLTGLLEAKAKLGDKGIYILCDITKLPLQNDKIDAVISLHTIYHVPQNQQTQAFDELYRVLKPGGRSIVVYSWGKHSALMKFFLYPFKLAKRAYMLAKGNKPALYFYANSYQWFKQQLQNKYDTKIFVWRSVNVPFLKIYIHSFLAGRVILRLIYKLEEKCPNLMGRIGAYPLLVTEKKSS